MGQFSAIFLAGQHDLQSKKRSKSNFDCRNEFLVVDYIGLDTSYDKIEDFTQNVRGGVAPPLWGGLTPNFLLEIKS